MLKHLLVKRPLFQRARVCRENTFEPKQLSKAEKKEKASEFFDNYITGSAVTGALVTGIAIGLDKTDEAQEDLFGDFIFFPAQMFAYGIAGACVGMLVAVTWPVTLPVYIYKRNKTDK